MGLNLYNKENLNQGVIMLMYFTIQMVAKISGVGVHTIRAWEKRYKAVVPTRDGSGHRVYSKADLEKLILLNDLCQEGYSISKIANLATDELKQIHLELNKEIVSVDEKISVDKGEKIIINPSETIVILKLALKSYKLDVVSKELAKIKNKLTIKDFVFKIIGPLVYDLGMAVHKGEYSIAQEHALSAIVKYHIGNILFQSDLNFKNRPTYIVAGIEGDLHEFGILQAALLCQYHKINVYYLGANLPSDALSDTLSHLDVEGIIIGASIFIENFDRKMVEGYLNRVGSKLSARQKFILGHNVYDFTGSLNMDGEFIQCKSLEDLDKMLSQL